MPLGHTLRSQSTRAENRHTGRINQTLLRFPTQGANDKGRYHAWRKGSAIELTYNETFQALHRIATGGLSMTAFSAEGK